jgi:PAS domain S-box-containing protein
LRKGTRSFQEDCWFWQLVDLLLHRLGFNKLSNPPIMGNNSVLRRNCQVSVGKTLYVLEFVMSSQSLPTQAKQLFQYLFEQASLGIAVEDLEGKLLLANPALCSMLGYREDELCGMSCSQFADPEDSQDDWALFQQLRAGVIDKYSLEKRYVRKHGGRLWGRLNVSLLRNGDGESPLVFAFVEDITERKRSEEALRVSEERFRLAAQAAKMYAYEWDVPTDKVVRSEEYMNVLGSSYQENELSRQQILATVHPDDRALFVDSVDQLTPQNSTSQVSYRVQQPDGPVVWLEKSARAFFDERGQLLRMIGMVANITERKRAEQSQRESEDKLRLLLDSTGEAIYGIDLEYRCTFCNLACLRALGYERIDEVVGKNMHDLMHHTRADGTLFPVGECRVHRVIQTGKGDHTEEEVLWRTNGTGFPAECWSYPQLRGEEVVGAVVAFVDITERKLAEVALASVSRRLIEAQEQERSRIARELHDDIGQRLAILAIKITQLQQSPPNSSELSSRIGELKNRTSEIAADIQSLSHELHSSRLQYLGIAAAIRGFCREFGEQQKVEIDFKIHDLPVLLSPDISLCFFRVLQEALHNSTKHSGVRYFEVELWGTPDEIHLTISDSGAGFDVDEARATGGLGLISMEERLKLLNGTLSIESQLQRGTTIHARVPFSSG